MSVGSRYMQREHGMIYTLIARHSSAILIIPLNNKGAWDPLTAQECVWRLCKEVCLFLHRECRTSNLGMQAFKDDKMKERCGGSLRDIRITSPEAKEFGPPPTIRKVVVAYFSAGTYGAQSCIDFWSLKDSLAEKDGAKARIIGEIVSKTAARNFSSRLWGCTDNVSLQKDHAQKAFNDAWTEIWDIDGFRGDGWPYYLTQLKNWLLVRSDQRIIRLCHSEGRRPRRPMQPGGDPDDRKTGLWKLVLGEKLEKVTHSSPEVGKYKRLPIEEVYGEQFSVVALDAVYMSAGNEQAPDEFPKLLGAKDPVHHATFKLGWSHCVALSDVGKSS